MKRVIALVLALMMALALCACGGGTQTNDEKTGSDTTTVTPNDNADVTPTEDTTEEGIKAETVAVGDKISLDFVEMTLDQFEVSDGYQFEYTDNSSAITITRKTSIDCSSGMKLVCLKGSFMNKFNKEVFPSNDPAGGVIIINGNEYSTTFECYNAAEAESILNIVPQQQVDYFLYAEVPASVADSIETCEVYIGFVENMDPSVWARELSDYDYLYKLEAIPTK